MHVFEIFAVISKITLQSKGTENAVPNGQRYSSYQRQQYLLNQKKDPYIKFG